MYISFAHFQCRAGSGACPDEMDSSRSCTNDISDVTGAVTDGQQCVSFTRQFSTCKEINFEMSSKIITK